MRNPMRILRKLIERNAPDQEFNEGAWNRAVDYCEQPAPRCDITGQPLTTRERFERECG